MSKLERCPITSTPCLEHGFIHGAEAEELREGLERLLGNNMRPTRAAILRLLDRVDARDSLGYLEATDEGGGR